MIRVGLFFVFPASSPSPPSIVPSALWSAQYPPFHRPCSATPFRDKATQANNRDKAGEEQYAKP